MVEYTSKTYLQDINKYEMKLYIDDSLPYAVSVKKIIEIASPFELNEDGNLIRILDDGYYVVEIVNLKGNYVLRLHVDKNGNLIEKIIILSRNNRILDGIPVFEDLKLKYVITKFNRKIYNREGFDKLRSNNVLNDDEYQSYLNEFKKLTTLLDDEFCFINQFDFKKYLF